MQVEELIPESALFQQLLDQEYKLDKLIEQKQAALRDYLLSKNYQQSSSHHIQVKKMRLVSFVERQQQQQQLTLHIQGYFVNEFGTHIQSASANEKCTNFVKRLVVELDKQHFPTNNIIEWEHTSTFAHRDGFSITRPIPTSMVTATDMAKAKIVLHVRHDTPLYTPSATLSKLLNNNNTSISMHQVIQALWQYVKMQQLQDANDARIILCDPYLKELCNADKLAMADVIGKLKEHLLVPEPLEWEVALMETFVKPVEKEVHIATATPTNTNTQEHWKLVNKSFTSDEFKQMNDQVGYCEY